MGDGSFLFRLAPFYTSLSSILRYRPIHIEEEPHTKRGQGGCEMDLQQPEQNKEDYSRKRKLKEEIADALKEWESAKRYFNYALGHEQVDYAIHAIITAEKRYTMLLSKAKKMKGSWPQWEGVAE
ncbi:DUF2508 family protein [Paenibacillus nanensis]|uniref:DUF2508 family protein n=2 Tax=Paenibacillus nanensis TaxID=393251 RepID=A0A3A1URW3_9BACL|nr:DUF2508 family protein [Paenibacillus nanensis]